MVYKDCDLEYAEQVTAEHKVNIKNVNGRSKTKWVPKYSHADNHYLDCEVYAFAAADLLNIRYLRPEEAEKKPVPIEEEAEEWIKSNENWMGQEA